MTREFLWMKFNCRSKCRCIDRVVQNRKYIMLNFRTFTYQIHAKTLTESFLYRTAILWCIFSFVIIIESTLIFWLARKSNLRLVGNLYADLLLLDIRILVYMNPLIEVRRGEVNASHLSIFTLVYWLYRFKTNFYKQKIFIVCT